MPLMLEGKNLHVHYGGIAAVRDITFRIGKGETVALIGANGAGKTSTLKAIARMLPQPDIHGSIRLYGEEITALPAHRLIEKGLALVPEGRGIFARLTVAENLALGAYSRNDKLEIAADLERVHGVAWRT